MVADVREASGYRRIANVILKNLRQVGSAGWPVLVAGVAGEFTLLWGWEVLRLRNRCALRSELFAESVDAVAFTRWRGAASETVEPFLDCPALQFGPCAVKESALLSPDKRECGWIRGTA